MKLSNTSIIKGLSIKDSIVAAINEMFNDRASAAYTDCLVVDAFVGTCIEVEVKDMYTNTCTSYFIATEILGTDFVRVDYCGNSEMVWNR
tara:strand:- start:161 stop:430 length:270 start_codon:yes stop_codon:yes gene_type:complete